MRKSCPPNHEFSGNKFWLNHKIKFVWKWIMILLSANSQQHGMAKCETKRTKRISYTFKIPHNVYSIYIIHGNTLNNDPFIDRMPECRKTLWFFNKSMKQHVFNILFWERFSISTLCPSSADYRVIETETFKWFLVEESFAIYSLFVIVCRVFDTNLRFFRVSLLLRVPLYIRNSFKRFESDKVLYV